ncbi:MAG: hypothetical protein VW547_14540 [Alphaproteobacteria bacterium]
MQHLKDLIAGDELIIAPCALNPLMAKTAAEVGFLPDFGGQFY